MAREQEPNNNILSDMDNSLEGNGRRSLDLGLSTRVDSSLVDDGRWSLDPCLSAVLCIAMHCRALHCVVMHFVVECVGRCRYVRVHLGMKQYWRE